MKQSKLLRKLEKNKPRKKRLKDYKLLLRKRDKRPRKLRG